MILSYLIEEIADIYQRETGSSLTQEELNDLGYKSQSELEELKYRLLTIASPDLTNLY
jgi:hypothetical protein